MAAYQLNRYPTPDALVVAAAAAWLEELTARQPSDRPYTVALSGGRIAHGLFQAIAREAVRLPQCLAGVHFFWADERCVPPDDAESNFAAAWKLLLQPANIPAAQIHRLRGEVNPAEAVREAVGELSLVVPLNAAGVPEFDLIFLGMGEDGHVASLFPEETDAARQDAAWYRSVMAVKPPPQRLTLGYGVLAAAKRVWVVASGAGKEKALQDSLIEGGNTSLARVIRSRKQTEIFTDIAG